MEYWEQRYAQGETSGPGSIGGTREWKWSIIDREVPSISSVIDLGCGDLTFWGERSPPKDYVGIDISPTIIRRNRLMWPQAKFKVGNIAMRDPDITEQSYEVGLCIDVLFHIMDDEDYLSTLHNLSSYVKKHIVISTWSSNPLKTLGATDGTYQYYRPPESFLGSLREDGWNLTCEDHRGSVNAIYIFTHNGDSV